MADKFRRTPMQMVQHPDPTGVGAEMLAVLESLFMAGQGVVECWEKGDLAGAVHMLEGALDDARPILVKARRSYPSE